MSDRPTPLPDLIAGRFRPVAQLGAGGMGLVYKAMDTRLNRAVAIKALHASRLREAGAASRLKTEALAAASLDHPYICKVYELIDEGADTFIVMEFVEGETLASILRRGRPPLAQTLRLAREIGEGLAAAHARGLVHRDIKPSNIMVTAHGHAKLLDFGIARADVASASVGETHTSPGSAASAYAGTPTYMAPEQAAGDPVSARADLFSLGVVLFECLTGKLPFAGTTAYDYVRHLLSDDPRPLYRLAPETPADLVTLVERCLEKKPADRPASASAVVVDLQRMLDSMTGTGAALRTAADVRAGRRFRLAAAAGAVLVVGFGLWQWFGPAPPDTIRQSRPVVASPNDEAASRISPDGQWMAFLSTRAGVPQLFVQRVDGGDAQPVALAGKPIAHVWSPDGGRLACVLDQPDGAVLHIVPAFFGGAVQQSVPLGPSLNPELLRWIDRTVYWQSHTGLGSRRALRALDLDRGTVRTLSDAWPDSADLIAFDVRPDGRRVAFTASSGAQQDLWTAELDGSSRARLTNDAFFERSPLWSGDGTLVIYASNRGGQVDLWEVAPDSGRVRQVTSSETVETPESSSADGALVSYLQESADTKLWIWDLAAGRGRQVTAGSPNDFSPVVSRAADMVAFQRSQASPLEGSMILDSKVFVASLDPSGLKSERAVVDGFAPALSPDGAWLAYLQRGTQARRLALHVERLATADTHLVSSGIPLPINTVRPIDWAEQRVAWAPDSSELYFIEEGEVQTLRRHPIDPRAAALPPLLAVKPNEIIRDFFLSADGRTLGYLTWSAKTYVAYARDLASGRDRELGRFTGNITEAFGRGSLAGNAGFVIVRRTKLEKEPGTATIEVLVASSGGPLRSAGTVEHAFMVTTRLDPARGVIYVTRSENGIHNLFAFSLATGALRRLSDNTLPGVTYSRVTPVGEDRVLGVRDERRKDIWISEIVPASRARPGR